jgi:DNA-binding protein H-NS
LQYFIKEKYMARQNYAVMQAKIEKEISRLRKQAETLQIKNRKPIIQSIVKSMKEYGISVEELATVVNKSGASKSTSSASNKAKKTSQPRGPVAIKYRHPETQATWTGRGKPPRWVSDAEAAGTHRTQFLVPEAK